MFEDLMLLLIALGGSLGVNAAYEANLHVMAIGSGLITVAAVYWMGVRSGSR